MKKAVVAAGIAVTLLTLAAVVLIVSARPPAPLQAGDKAPDFKLTGAFGGEGKLSDYRGKVVLLNFWATWCAPCIQEMPSLQRLFRGFGGPDFEIVAVSLDAEGATVVQNFAERNRLEFSLAVDPEKVTESLYGLTGLPETYLIDGDGVIVEKILGPRDWASGESVTKIAKLLGHGPVRRRAPSAATGATEAVTGATEPVTGAAE